MSEAAEDVMHKDDDAEFELYMDGDLLAGAAGPRQRAWNEILHYMTMYASEGTEFKVEEITRRVVPINFVSISPSKPQA